MNIEEYMNVALPAKLAKIRMYTLGRSDKLKIVVQDRGGWIIDYNSDPASVTKTDIWGDAQVEFTEEQFERFINDPYSGLKMHLNKEIVVKGITYNLMDLPRLFDMIRLL